MQKFQFVRITHNEWFHFRLHPTIFRNYSEMFKIRTLTILADSVKAKKKRRKYDVDIEHENKTSQI
jgi:hypothetical protein